MNPIVEKRFLIVLGNFGHMGGAERQAFYFIEYLRKEIKAPVSVLGWYGDGPLAEQLRQWGCNIYNFPYKANLRSVSKAINLMQLAAFIRKTIKPDIILPFVSIHSKPICQIWNFTGAQYVWWNQQDEGRMLYGTSVEKKALLNAVHITSNSVAGADFLHKTYGIPKERIIVYNNGTPIPDVKALKPIWRERLGLGPETRLVSMLANVTRYKDHKTLFYAWQKVQEHFKRSTTSVKLLLAGHLKDKTTVQYLKAFGFDLNLSDSIAFLGPIDTTNELIMESELIVHSSNKEGCPNSVCEAMALAKPVVGTDISGMRQALGIDHYHYCLSEPNNPADLAQKIIHLLGNPELAQETGNFNLARIMDEFSIEDMVCFFLGLIHDHMNVSV